MLPPRKLNKSKRTKKKEAYLMGFKLIINNQGQFISEFKNFPMDKIPIYFKKENENSFGNNNMWYDGLSTTSYS